MNRWLLLLFFSTALHAGGRWNPPPTAWHEPWGKDASLARSTEPHDRYHLPSDPPSSPAADTSILAIRFFQQVISPIDGPRSHFVPSSSQYTLRAIQKHGFFKGYLMGCSRLLRENADPWIYRRVVTLDGDTYKEDLP